MNNKLLMFTCLLELIFAFRMFGQETGLVTSYDELQADEVVLLKQTASDLYLGSRDVATNHSAACLVPFSLYNEDMQFGVGYVDPTNFECQFYVKSTASQTKYFLHAISSNGYTTQIGEYTYGGLTTWYLESNADGTTKIRNSQTTGSYLGSDALISNSALYRDKTGYVDWKIYRLAELQAAKATELESATNDLPIEITDVAILNSSFEDGNPELGWRNNGFQRQNNDAFSGTKDGSYYCEKWVTRGTNLPSAKIHQTLVGLPNGKYEISIQGGIKIQSSTDEEDLPGSGMKAFANYSYRSMDAVIGDYSVITCVTDGQLVLGVELEDVIGNYAYFDNVELKYYGGSLDAYISTLDPMIVRANEILDEGAFPVASGVALEAAVEDAENAKSASSLDDVLTAIQTLNNALVQIEQIVADYQDLKGYIDEVETAISVYNRTDLSVYYDTLLTAFNNQLWDDSRIEKEIDRRDSLFYSVELEAADSTPYTIKQRFDVDLVESSFPVAYAQAIADDNHFIAYYDKDKNLCIGYRKLNESSFNKTILNSKIAWDSHNYIEMIVDNEGYIHVSGNMHNVQLNYWRSKNPYDASEFEMLNYMTGSEEDNTTYPKFLMTNSGDLLFHYRYGWSGNGYEIYNIWDPQTKTWSRFLDEALIDGLGERNAYMSGPYYEADGYYHLYWVWRETPDAATNHDFSYARSKDLKNWESAAGDPVASPILFSEEKLRVDISSSMYGTGILNGVQKHTLDSQNRIVLVNMKYDALGNSQLYVYRMKDDKTWEEKCITNWIYRYQFGGGGSLLFEIELKGMRNLGGGELGVTYSHSQYGEGEIIIDEETLEPIAIREYAKTYPTKLDSVTISGTYSKPIEVKIDQIGNYILRWETMGESNDQMPSGTLPPYFMLELIELESAATAIPSNYKTNGDLTVVQIQSNLKIGGLAIGNEVVVIDAWGRVISTFVARQKEYYIAVPTSGFYIISSGGESRKIIVQ